MDAKFEDESDFKPRHACPERDEICRHRVVRLDGSAHLGVTEEAIIQMSLAPEILRYRIGCSGRADTRGSHKKRLGWRGAASGPQPVAAAARNSIYVDLNTSNNQKMRSLDHGPPAPKRVTRDVVCRLCRWLCSVVSHATEQRCVVSHATEQRCVACYRAAFVTEQTCGVVSVAWRCGRLLSSLVSSVLRVCIRPYCALRSFRDDDVDDDDECPSVAILAQETSVRFSPQALNTAFYAQ